MPNVLGVQVATTQIDEWREWFAPPQQPFRTDRLLVDLPHGRELEPTPEVRDTFHMYGGSWVWLEEGEFRRLSLPVRRSLLVRREALGRVDDLPAKARDLVGDSYTDTRVVWWPSLLRRVGDAPIARYIEDGVCPSRHRDVPASTWVLCERVLPGAADLAGTFAAGSGPNCFGTVMASAGVSGAESEWMWQEPFERWLTETTMPIRGTGHDQAPGVVLVWRDAEGLANHAAVTIGHGFALSKPSQAWCSPRLVWTVRDTIAAAYQRGSTLSRYRISAR